MTFVFFTSLFFAVLFSTCYCGTGFSCIPTLRVTSSGTEIFCEFKFESDSSAKELLTLIATQSAWAVSKLTDAVNNIPFLKQLEVGSSETTGTHLKVSTAGNTLVVAIKLGYDVWSAYDKKLKRQEGLKSQGPVHYEEWKQIEDEFMKEIVGAITATLGSMAGGAAGAMAGGAAGATLGSSICPVVGTAIGAAVGTYIGAAAGGYLGWNIGKQAGESLSCSMYGSCDKLTFASN